MVNAIRQSAWLSVKSRHISDNCTKATPSVCAPHVLCTSANAQRVLSISVIVICVFLKMLSGMEHYPISEILQLFQS